MTFWTPDTLRTATGGTWLIRPPQIALPKDRPADLPLPPLHAPITGLSTDTRSIKPGQCFLALIILTLHAKAGANQAEHR
jgi:hypothetical protein